MGPPKIIITYYVYDFNLTSVQCSWMQSARPSVIVIVMWLVWLKQKPSANNFAQFSNGFSCSSFLLFFFFFCILFLLTFFHVIILRTHLFSAWEPYVLREILFFSVCRVFDVFYEEKKVLLLCSRNWNSCDRKR